SLPARSRTRAFMRELAPSVDASGRRRSRVHAGLVEFDGQPTLPLQRPCLYGVPLAAVRIRRVAGNGQLVAAPCGLRERDDILPTTGRLSWHLLGERECYV